VQGLVTGCATPQDDKAQITLDSDPRVGEEVQHVCYVRDLDGWQNVDDDSKAVILRMRNRETYKVTLKGPCYPDFASLTVAVRTRSGSGCFSAGDEVRTDGDAFRGSGPGCTITSTHKWDSEAVSKSQQADQ